MAYLLPPERDDDIRRAVDPMLDYEAIPVDLIRSDIYLGEAERWALSLDPLGGTRSGVEQDSFYRAIVYMTASLISITVPQSRQVNMAGHTATFTFAETPEQRTARLAGIALAYIAAYLPLAANPTANMPIFVTTVSGRRA